MKNDEYNFIQSIRRTLRSKIVAPRSTSPTGDSLKHGKLIGFSPIKAKWSNPGKTNVFTCNPKTLPNNNNIYFCEIHRQNLFKI